MPDTTFTKAEVADMLRSVASQSKAEMAEFARSLVQEMKKLNPIEERKLKDELERERKRGLFMIELGKIEEATQLAKKNSCTHRFDKETGDMAPAGDGKWRTSGQVHADGTATLICMLCCYTWHWMASPQEREYSINAPHGFLYFAPPDESRLLVDCAHCSKSFAKSEHARHESTCYARPAAVVVADAKARGLVEATA